MKISAKRMLSWLPPCRPTCLPKRKNNPIRRFEQFELRLPLATIVWTFDQGAPPAWQEGGMEEGCEEAEDGMPVRFPWEFSDGVLTGQSTGDEPPHRQCSWVETPSFQFLEDQSPVIRFDVSYEPKFSESRARDQVLARLVNVDTGDLTTVVFDFLSDTLLVPPNVELSDEPQEVEKELTDVQPNVNYRVRFLARDYDPRATIGQFRFDNLTLTNVVAGENLPVLRVPGDVNGDEQVTAADISDLCLAIHAGDSSELFDLTHDDRVDQKDYDALVHDILGTTAGDANLDGVFNSADLIMVFQAGQYEDSIDNNSSWAAGDWNCDREFTSSDLIAAFQTGNYQRD